MDVLQIEKHCRDLIVSAADAVDRQAYEAFVALFVPDAMLIRPGGIKLHGRHEILASYQNKDPNRLTHHLICQHHIQVDSPQVAQSRCKVLLYSSHRERELTPKGRLADAQHQIGVMEDTLVLTDTGWKIQTRHAWFELFTDN